jgi:hypothetical protein
MNIISKAACFRPWSYCMFHYAVDVIAGLLLGVFAVLEFNRADSKRYYGETSKERIRSRG